MSTPFEYTTQVRFHQADPAGVLFYGRVFELVNDAYEALVHAAGLGYDDHFGLRGYATPVVHVAADYRRPMAAGETLTVALDVARLGYSSLTLHFTVTGADGMERAIGEVVHAFVDVRTGLAGRTLSVELLGVNRLDDPRLRGIVVSLHDVTERDRR